MNASAETPAPAIGDTIMQRIRLWLDACAKLEQYKQQELELRKELASVFFPEPAEGTNRVQAAQAEIKLEHKLNRKLDEAALDAVMPQLPEAYRQLGVLINYKPSFDLKTYRGLPEEYCAIFDQALVVTPGTPALTIVLREDGDPALDPATSPAVPDWPARMQEQPPATPIMDAYHKAKGEAAPKPAKEKKAPATKAAKPAKAAPKKKAK